MPIFLIVGFSRLPFFYVDNFVRSRLLIKYAFKCNTGLSGHLLYPFEIRKEYHSLQKGHYRLGKWLLNDRSIKLRSAAYSTENSAAVCVGLLEPNDGEQRGVRSDGAGRTAAGRFTRRLGMNRTVNSSGGVRNIGRVH